MDYHKYMSQGRGSSAGQGGDYHQFMDYQKYMSQGSSAKGGGQGGDFKEYYQNYMSQGSGKNAQGGDYQKYYQQYMSSGGGKQGGASYMPEVRNWSNKEAVSEAFRKKYAGSY